MAKRARVSDLADFLTDRIVACCVARRLNKRERPNPPFTGVEFDVSDAPSEACVVSTFIVYADAAAERWERTVQRALGDLQLLSAHGLSCAEVEAMRAAILADSRLRAQQGATPSAELLSVMMESDCLGHTFVEPSHYDQALQLASEAVDDARVNSRMRDLISHITRYGEPDAPRPAAVVVCMPERGGDGVVDDRKLSARLDAMLRARAATASAALDVPTPSELIPPDVLDFRARATPPAWAGGPAEGGKELKCVDERSGAVIQLRRLANGVAVSTVRTASESDAVVLRLCAPGGRAAEDSSLPGALLLATATMLHGGSVGALSREQVELYCISHLIELNMEVRRRAAAPAPRLLCARPTPRADPPPLPRGRTPPRAPARRAGGAAPSGDGGGGEVGPALPRGRARRRPGGCARARPRAHRRLPLGARRARVHARAVRRAA